ncbi:esterase family protein [Subdoligranulum variabile]|uniref:alpha/beta hydrolase n=1 Tax=Subdoligranulum variabile TaxID=214851 RepID=UPI0026EE2DCF|nr:alpha/beta hydrolase-fold protein [Subdoligranulum variabile]
MGFEILTTSQSRSITIWLLGSIQKQFPSHGRRYYATQQNITVIPQNALWWRFILGTRQVASVWKANAWDETHGEPAAVRGTICQERYTAHISQKEKCCYIYTPPGYGETAESYPVLYLQHGYGENELGWIYQGKLAEIADQLIWEEKIRPMLIVTADGMMREEKENGDIAHRPELFTEELLRDIMPLVEKRYRVKPGKDNHALAGLSMGSLQTSMTVFTNIGLFGWVGLFSGFMGNIFDGNNAHLAHLAEQADAFNQQTRLFFRGMGGNDPFWESFQKDDSLCEKYGIRCVRKQYDGAHTWNVWRQCIVDFLELLFR